MRTCQRCGTDDDTRRLFCPECGASFSLADLRRVRLMGLVGVENSTSPKIEQFWQTGDPAVFETP